MAKPVVIWPAIVSLLGALVLEVLPLPDALSFWRPPFLTLTIIYWVMMWPNRIGVATAFLLGLALDTLHGSLLGQNALTLSLVAYLCYRFHLQIRIFPLLQLTGSVAALLLVSAFVQFWIDGVAGLPSAGLLRGLPVITGTIVWPFLMGALDRLRYSAENRNTGML